jgi:hypothetical protein
MRLALGNALSNGWNHTLSRWVLWQSHTPLWPLSHKIAAQLWWMWHGVDCVVCFLMCNRRTGYYQAQWTACLLNWYGFQRPPPWRFIANHISTYVAPQRIEVSIRQWIPKTESMSWSGALDRRELILDARVTNADATSYRSKDPEKVLDATERLPENKYLQPCLDHRRHLNPFVVPVDVPVGKDTLMVIKTPTENQA